MIDLPATAIVFVGILWSSRGRWAAFAAAPLTQETSLMAAPGFFEWPPSKAAALPINKPKGQSAKERASNRRPEVASHLQQTPWSPSGWNVALWKRNFASLALAVLSFGPWLLYIGQRFHGLTGTAGIGNFSFPCWAMAARVLDGFQYCGSIGISAAAKAGGPFGWLYLDTEVHELLAMIALFSQGLYLVLRRNSESAIWRAGLGYVVLGCVLGASVWGWTGAAARVLLPMTGWVYLLIGEERDRWFWPFFQLGSVSIPDSLHHFWTLTP